ncbi:MAG TPA: mitomycin antibiotic biosynthesis protein [Candidatus Latescibacteria bacterium]|nr:mitomycin antibiotic biosynthesis protein [Candidatus Latescibacterota bacterium]
MSLSEDQIQEYGAKGVLRVRGALSFEDLQPVIEELEEIIDRRARQLHAEGEIEELWENEPFEIRYGLLYRQSRSMGKGLDIMQYRGSATFSFLGNDRLLNVLQSLLGEEITCNPIQHLRAKPPDQYEEHTGPSIHHAPWHQDAAVMMPEAEGSEVITCWLPLGEATAEMGCMEVIPDQVDGGYLPHQKEGGTTVVPALLPETEPVIMACDKGDIVLMSRFTPHRSRPNVSKRCRWSLDLRYQPTGQHTGRTGHPDFVVRSALHPDRVVDDHPAWCRMWEEALENRSGVVMHRSV